MISEIARRKKADIFILRISARFLKLLMGTELSSAICGDAKILELFF